jgi:hypothetical protein
MPEPQELVWTDCHGLCPGKSVHEVIWPARDTFRCVGCGVSHPGVVRDRRTGLPVEISDLGPCLAPERPREPDDA